MEELLDFVGIINKYLYYLRLDIYLQVDILKR